MRAACVGLRAATVRGSFADKADKLGNLVWGRLRRRRPVRLPQDAMSVFAFATCRLASPAQPMEYAIETGHFGSKAFIAGSNSIIGCAASHMRSKMHVELSGGLCIADHDQI
jgi:hypothetical protein